jgi:ABC-2 type transport system permease protein
MLYYQLRNELWKLFGKKRTYIGFAMCFLAESIFIVMFCYNIGPRRDMTRHLELMGYLSSKFISNLTIATSVLMPIAVLLMPLYVSLVGGDLMAKEAEDGTLRMILARPISRLRLVTIKWLAGAIFSVVLAVLLGGFGILFASFFFPSGGLFAMLPMDGIFSVFDAAEGWWRYAAATMVLSIAAITMMGMSWMFSCCNVKPAAATILALSILLTSQILQQFPYFHDLQGWFITYHLAFWMRMFQQPIPPWNVGESLSILFGFNVTFFIIGASIFQMRDIKS